MIPVRFSAPVRVIAVVIVLAAAFWSLGFRGGVETVVILGVVLAVDRFLVRPLRRRRQLSRTG